MSDAAVNLIDLNEKINYSVFMTLFCSYFILLWMVISIWIGVDAWKRYGNKSIAFTFFFLTFILNVPMLILYFVVRPEEKYEYYDEWETGGVNVPLVNFTGKQGVEMVLEMKLNPVKLATKQADMKIDVSWESQDQDKQLISTISSGDLPARADRKVSNVFSNFGGLIRKRIVRIKEVSADYLKHSRRPKISPTEDKNEIETAQTKKVKTKSNKKHKNSKKR